MSGALDSSSRRIPRGRKVLYAYFGGQLNPWWHEFFGSIFRREQSLMETAAGPSRRAFFCQTALESSAVRFWVLRSCHFPLAAIELAHEVKTDDSRVPVNLAVEAVTKRESSRS
jgi:hypothetical protein